ncbi:MAG: phosphoribosyltransferase [Candidatus Geothermarchaeota archaeon]
MNFEVPTLSDIYSHVIKIANKIKESGIKIDLIVGIARGGLIPARILSDLLLIPRVKIIHAGFYISPGRTLHSPIIYTSIDKGDVEGKNILLVDDVADTGETLLAIKEHLVKNGAASVYVAVIYKKPWNKAEIDFHAKETEAWIIFPWEYIETIRQLIDNKMFDEYKSTIVKDELHKKLINKFVTERCIV